MWVAMWTIWWLAKSTMSKSAKSSKSTTCWGRFAACGGARNTFFVYFFCLYICVKKTKLAKQSWWHFLWRKKTGLDLPGLDWLYFWNFCVLPLRALVAKKIIEIYVGWGQTFDCFLLVSTARSLFAWVCAFGRYFLMIFRCWRCHFQVLIFVAVRARFDIDKLFTLSFSSRGSMNHTNPCFFVRRYFCSTGTML